MHRGFRVYSYNAGTVADATISWFTDINFEETLLGQGTGDDPVIIPKTAQLGTEYSYTYTSVSESELTGEALELILQGQEGVERSSTTIRSNVSVRYAYVGFQEIDDLFPSADPIQVNDGAEALVRVSEITTESTTETELTVNGITASSETETPASTLTTIEWVVYGLGTVEFRVITGAYMDAIISEPVFDDGDGIVGTRSLDEITGGFYDVIEQLSGVTGNGAVRDASDVVVDGVIPLLGDGSGSPVADAWWSRNSEAVEDGWFSSADFASLIFVSQDALTSADGAGWTFLPGLGFVYTDGTAEGALWWYSPELGWLGTSAEGFPYPYINDEAVWKYFAEEDGVGWLYDFASEGWSEVEG